jgi:predicted ATPase
MVPDQSGSLVFYSENIFDKKQAGFSFNENPGPSFFESRIFNQNGNNKNPFIKSIDLFKVFHFHDSGFNAQIKQPCATNDYSSLQSDGGNIAAFLYRLQESSPQYFQMIESVIRSVAPFFNKFLLIPDEINPGQIFLRWFEIGSEKVFSAHNFSDGTLRFICLCALLLQPNPPETIIIDEPELGLHPFAINKLTALIKSVSVRSQIIISTQSVNFVSDFEPEDILVVERENNQTVFHRQNTETLKNWLTDFSLGELWEKNVFAGNPK